MAQIAANLQRIKNGQRRYAITPRIPGGFIQPEQLQKYIKVANEFGAVLKLTASQRIMITNLKAEDVDKAWEMLGMEPAYTVSNRVRSVKICPGTTFCKRAKQDSVHLGMQIERKYLSQEMPNKMKIGVSGCLNSCTESRLKDVGIIGTVEGWNVYAGGSGGAHPRIGDLIAEVTTEKEALALVDRIIAYYKENAQIERMGEFIDRIGLEAFKAAVLGDLEGAPAESKSEEPAVFLPGQGNDPEVEAPRLEVGSITPDTIIRDIVYISKCCACIAKHRHGLLRCPSATAEPLWQAAEIHGFNVYDLVQKLETARKGLICPHS